MKCYIKDEELRQKLELFLKREEEKLHPNSPGEFWKLLKKT